MQRLEVSGAVRLIYRSLGVKGLRLASMTVLYDIQGASVNRAILQHCFFVVRQHWGGCRYRHFVANFKAF